MSTSPRMSEAERLTLARKPPAPWCGRTLHRSSERYLTALYADAPQGSLIEVRYRVAAGMRRAFYDAAGLDLVAAVICERAPHTDVYLGVVPRSRRGGGRDDLVDHARVLWADCDTPESVAALGNFSPAPSIVVASGTGDNRHAYWLLAAPVAIDTVERANRRLAWLLGADVSCAEPARILRPPSLNHKHDPPTLVRVERCDAAARHRLGDIVGSLDARGDESPMLHRAPNASQRTTDDPLLLLPAPTYVERLAGLHVPRSGKVRCPFHDDHTPSLHVYADPGHGWYCFGCGQGGSIYDFAALLWGQTTRGPDFVDLQRQLRDVLGVTDAC
jgi:hypothetical protein